MDAVRRACIKQLPHMLVIQLKRFEFDYETMTQLKLKAVIAEQGRLVKSKDRPARVKGWRPYDIVVLKIHQLKRHLDVHEKVLRAKLHEESISRHVQQAMSSYAPVASGAMHSVLLKEASIQSAITKEATPLMQLPY